MPGRGALPAAPAGRVSKEPAASGVRSLPGAASSKRCIAHINTQFDAWQIGGAGGKAAHQRATPALHTANLCRRAWKHALPAAVVYLAHLGSKPRPWPGCLRCSMLRAFPKHNAQGPPFTSHGQQAWAGAWRPASADDGMPMRCRPIARQGCPPLRTALPSARKRAG